MRAALLLVAMLGSGCMFVFDGDREDEPTPIEPCGREPASAKHRNPESLTCDSVTDSCQAPHPPPSSTWPTCGHACETLDEDACRTAPTCRVVTSALCATGALKCDRDESFVGCFPIDTTEAPAIDCWTANAGQCASNNRCTAYHYASGCLSDQCQQWFQFCGPEGMAPGECDAPVACDAAPPPCAAGETPGVLNGCYTGACIPREACVWVCAAPPCV